MRLTPNKLFSFCFNIFSSLKRLLQDHSYKWKPSQKKEKEVFDTIAPTRADKECHPMETQPNVSHPPSKETKKEAKKETTEIYCKLASVTRQPNGDTQDVAVGVFVGTDEHDEYYPLATATDSTATAEKLDQSTAAITTTTTFTTTTTEKPMSMSTTYLPNTIWSTAAAAATTTTATAAAAAATTTTFPYANKHDTAFVGMSNGFESGYVDAAIFSAMMKRPNGSMRPPKDTFQDSPNPSQVHVSLLALSEEDVPSRNASHVSQGLLDGYVMA